MVNERVNAPTAADDTAQNDSTPLPGQMSRGVLELHTKGFGFLRNPARSYAAQRDDAYVSGPLIQEFKLRAGHSLAGPTEPSKQGTGPRLTTVAEIEGGKPEDIAR